MKINFEKKYTILYIVLILLYTLGAAFSSILTAIGFIITLFLLLNTDNQHALELQLILVPFSGIMFIGQSVTLFNIIQFVFVLILLKRKKYILNKHVLIFMILTLFVSVYGIAVTSMSNIKSIISFIFEMAIIALMINDISGLDFDKAIRSFSMSLIISSCVYLFIDYLPGLKRYISVAQYRLEGSLEKVSRFSGLLGNPNHYTMALSVAIAGLLVTAVCRKAKLCDWIYLAAMVIFGIMSLSKSFFLGLIFTLVIVILYVFVKKPSKGIALVTAAFGAGLIFLLKDNFYYFDIIMSRMAIGDADLNTYTSNRFDHYAVYIQKILNSLRILFFGNGYGTLIDGMASHNIYLEAVYYFGIVGIIALGWTLLKIYRDSLGRGKGILRFLIVLVILFRGLAINIFTSIIFPYYIILALMMMKTDCYIQTIQKGG